MLFETIESHTVYTPGLASGPVVVDLGAHTGEFARAMEARYGGTYYLVEANPVLADALRSGTRFRIWHRAITDSDGVVSFNIAKDPKGSSVLTLPLESRFNCVHKETVQVPASTFDSLLVELQTPRIDVLKMDIEGAEVQVLQGLAPAILDSIGQITVEFHSQAVFGFNLEQQVEGTIRYLKNQGFVFLDFSSKTRLDVLFVNRRYHEIPWRRAKLWEIRSNPPRLLLNLWAAVPAGVRNRLRGQLNQVTGTEATPAEVQDARGRRS